MSLPRKAAYRTIDASFRALGWDLRRRIQSARSIAKKTLRNIIRLNGDTVWGREHHLDKPTAVETFYDLPMTTYQDYHPYLEKISAGEHGILTSERVTFLYVTAGTTGPPKLIPSSRRQSMLFMRHMLGTLGLAIHGGALGPIQGPWFHFLVPGVKSKKTPGGVKKGGASTQIFRQMRRLSGLLWASPSPVFNVQHQAATRYLHLLYTLKEEKLWTIMCFFPSFLLYFLNDMRSHSESLLRDMADGTITEDIGLSSKERDSLAPYLEPDPGRARALQLLLDRDRFTTDEIWPHMVSIVTADSGSCDFYLEQCRPFLGTTQIFSPSFAASEGIAGVRFPPLRHGYVISPLGAYVEFLPVEADAGSSPGPVSLDMVEVGKSYEIILTTYTGLTRYRMGDIVTVIDWYGEAPVVEFIQRSGQALNLLAENVAVGEIEGAFIDACNELQASVVDYVVTVDTEVVPARYLLLIERRESSGNPTGSFDTAELVKKFDQNLRELNAAYKAMQDLKMLAPMAALLLEPRSFDGYIRDREAEGAPIHQIKIPHAMPDPTFARTHFPHGKLLTPSG